MTTDATATSRRDYALLSAAFAAGVAAMSAAARHDGAEVRRAESAELPALALATFGLSRILVHERVAAWARTPFVDEGRDDRPPRGDGLRRAVGELLTCTRCTGVWVGAALLGTRMVSPAAGRVMTAVFASAGANDLLQAGFAGLGRRAGGG